MYGRKDIGGYLKRNSLKIIIALQDVLKNMSSILNVPIILEKILHAKGNRQT